MFGRLNANRLHRIMRSMPRERRQDGWVERTGKQVKVWTGFYYEYVRMPDGTEKRRKREKRLGLCKDLTKGGAEDKLRALIRSKHQPESADTFEAFARWYLQTKQAYWAVGTRKLMASIFETHIIPRLGAVPAARITKSHIENVLGEISAIAGSESMLKKCLTHIRAVFQMACDDEKLERNPGLKAKLPQVREPSERFLELEECRRLLTVADGVDRLIVRTFLTLGLRPSELFALRRDDLTPGRLRIDEAVVRCIVGGTKTKDAAATIPIPQSLETALREYVATHKSEWIFPSAAGTPISHDNYLDRKLKPLGQLARIEGLNFQVLRRTCATHFQARHATPKDAQALLRHGNLDTTNRHYIKSISADVVKGVESWDAELTVN